MEQLRNKIEAPEHTPLSFLLNRIKKVIEQDFSSNWVSAEVTEVNTNKGGHLF